jgi:MFS family permease
VTLFLFTEPVGQLVDRAGAKPVLMAGTAVTAAGAVLLAQASSLAGFIGYQVVLGVGLSALLGTPVRYVALSETNDQERASAQGLVSLAGSFGAMIGSTLAGAFLASHPNDLGGFRNIFLTAAVVNGLGFLLSLGLSRREQAAGQQKPAEKQKRS